MRRPLVVFSLWLALASCGAQNGKEISTPPTDAVTSSSAVVLSEGESLAREAGCRSVTHDDWEYWSGRWRLDESLSCDMDGDGEDELWVHMFDPAHRDFVRRQFDRRYDVSQAVDDCPGDEVPVGDWVLVGSEWVMATTQEGLIRDLAERFEAELLAGGPRVGSPVSYPTLERCQ